MTRHKEVSNINYGGRSFSSHAILNSDGTIFWEPTFFLVYKAKAGNKPATIDAYAEDLVRFLNVVVTSSGGLNWKDVTDKQITAYIHNYLQKQRLLKIKSVTRHIATLKSFYDWAWDIKLLEKPSGFTFGYSDEIPKGESVSIATNYINQKEFDDLLGSVDQKDSFLLERDELVLGFGYYTGVRAQEIVDARNFNTEALRRKIFEAIDNNRLTFNVEIIGKGEKIREIVIPPDLFEMLEKFLLGRRKKYPAGQIICKKDGLPLNRQHASTVFSTAVDNCSEGIRERLLSLGYHSLRHTFATNLVTYCYENNRDPWQLVPERMGHEDKETTLGYIEYEAYLNNRLDVIKKLSLGKRNKYNNNGINNER